MYKSYSYSSVDSFYYPNTDMKIYKFNNLSFIKNNALPIKIIDDLCFLISLKTNYSHALLDGIGTYYQLKKIYPSIIPIFIESGSDNNKTLVEFLNKNNHQSINFDNNNYCFSNVILHSYCFAPVDFTKIESEDIFSENNRYVARSFYKNSIKEILKNVDIPQNKKNKKIYVSRSTANKNRKLSNNIYASKNLTYDEKYDIEIEKLMKEKGYEVISLEGYSLSEHIELFSQCSKVVSIEGSGLINLIFAPDDCKILSIKLINIEAIFYDLLASCNKNNILICNLLEYSVDDAIKKISNYLNIL